MAVVGKVVMEEEQLTCDEEVVVWVEGRLLADECVGDRLWGSL